MELVVVVFQSTILEWAPVKVSVQLSRLVWPRAATLSNVSLSFSLAYLTFSAIVVVPVSAAAFAGSAMSSCHHHSPRRHLSLQGLVANVHHRPRLPSRNVDFASVPQWTANSLTAAALLALLRLFWDRGGAKTI